MWFITLHSPIAVSQSMSNYESVKLVKFSTLLKIINMLFKFVISDITDQRESHGAGTDWGAVEGVPRRGNQPVHQRPRHQADGRLHGPCQGVPGWTRHPSLSGRPVDLLYQGHQRQGTERRHVPDQGPVWDHQREPDRESAQDHDGNLCPHLLWEHLLARQYPWFMN